MPIRYGVGGFARKFVHSPKKHVNAPAFPAGLSAGPVRSGEEFGMAGCAGGLATGVVGGRGIGRKIETLGRSTFTMK